MAFRLPITWLALPLLLAAGIGCGPNLRMPNLLHPGTAGEQQLDAIYRDPYTLNDVAPEVVGGRPREYANAVPEVTRGRLLLPPSTASQSTQILQPGGMAQPGAVMVSPNYSPGFSQSGPGSPMQPFNQTVPPPSLAPNPFGVPAGQPAFQ